jgi:hypothetical protein
MSTGPAHNSPAVPLKHDELDVLLTLASKGQLPLFHQEWVRASFDGLPRRMSLSRASQVVQDGLKRLERHGSFDRKQTALSAFTNEERRDFIQSFFKMVECKTLDGLKELH